MAQTVEIKVEAKGIGGLRSEIKSLKNEILDLQSQDIVDEAKLNKLQQQLGQSIDKMQDLNETAKAFAGGSQFEIAGNQLSLFSSKLSDLDFAGAKEQATAFKNTLTSINPEKLKQGFADFAGGIKQVGSAFVQVGLQLLKNPILLLVAVITAIVVALYQLKDTVKIAETAFNAITAPIKLVIDLFKQLTDAIGLTSFATDEWADKTVKANERASKASAENTKNLTKDFDRRIALLKAEGKNTDDLEKEKQLAIQKGASQQIATIDARIKALQKKNEDATSEEKAKNDEAIADLQTQKNEQSNIYLDAGNQRKVITAEANTAEREATKKHNDELAKIEKDAKAKAKAEKLRQQQEDAKALAEAQKRSADDTLKLQMEALNAIDQATEQNINSTLTQQEQEVRAVNDKYFRLIELAKQFGLDTTELEIAKANEINDINLKAQKENYDNEKANSDAKILLAEKEFEAKQKILQSTGELLGTFADLLGKQTAEGKALAVAQALINAYLGISEVWKAPNPYPEPFGTAVKIASTATIALSAFKTVKDIMAVKVPKSSSKGGGSVPSSAGSTAPAPAPIVPQTTTNGQGSSGGATQDVVNESGKQQISVKAIVVESDITSTQNKISKIENGSTLGG